MVAALRPGLGFKLTDLNCHESTPGLVPVLLYNIQKFQVSKKFFKW